MELLFKVIAPLFSSKYLVYLIKVYTAVHITTFPHIYIVEDCADFDVTKFVLKVQLSSFGDLENK